MNLPSSLGLAVAIMVVSELLASTSQILLKKSAGIAYASRIREYLNPYVMGGYGMLFVSMLLTILAYRATDSYMIVPVLETMGYIFVLLLGRLVFGEPITRNKLLGILCILGGIALFNL